MTSFANGRRTFKNAWRASPNICESLKRPRLMWQSLGGISMDMVTHVRITSTSATWRVLDGLWARISKRPGQVQISWHPVFGRWVWRQDMIPWTISGMGGISERLLVSVCLFFLMLRLQRYHLSTDNNLNSLREVRVRSQEFVFLETRRIVE